MALEPGLPHPRNDTSNHPVWNVYDEYRTARFNVSYYTHQLERTRRTNLIVEIVLAFTASGSLVSSVVLQGPLGAALWKGMGVVAAGLAVAKPIINWTERIRCIEATISGYRGLELDLRKIEVAIREAGAYTPELRQRFAQALDRKQELVTRELHLRDDKTLKQRCQEEVKRQLPVDRFFVPAEAK